MPLQLEWGQISGSALVGIAIGAWIGHKFALGRDRRKEFQEAGKQFRESFIELRRLLALRHPNHVGGQEFQEAFTLIPKYYNILYEAKVRFEPYIAKRCRPKFQSTWDRFCCVAGAIPYPTFADYKSLGNHIEELAKRDLAIQRIELLCKFTR